MPAVERVIGNGTVTAVIAHWHAVGGSGARNWGIGVRRLLSDGYLSLFAKLALNAKGKQHWHSTEYDQCEGSNRGIRHPIASETQAMGRIPPPR